MIFIYNMEALEEQHCLGLIGLLNGMNEPWKQLESGDLNLTVEELLNDGQGQLNKGPEDAPNTTFMLMDVSETVLDGILKKLKEKEIKIPYKAVVTDNNRSWLFGDLLAHVIDEDREVRAIVKLQRLLVSTEKFEESQFDPEAWQIYMAGRNDVVEFMSRVEKNEVTPDEAEKTLHNFNQCILDMIGNG